MYRGPSFPNGPGGGGTTYSAGPGAVPQNIIDITVTFWDFTEGTSPAVV